MMREIVMTDKKPIDVAFASMNSEINLIHKYMLAYHEKLSH